VFAAFARALSFPDYFGRNWDALADCLHDWHGHGALTKDLAVVIEDADQLVDLDFLGVFISVLCQAAWQANLQHDADGRPDPDRQAFAVHFVFVLDTTATAAFAAAAATAKDVRVTLLDGCLTAALDDDN
jgi:hypothetical protein